MILSVTLNPAFDKIYWVEDLKFDGEVGLSRAYRSHSSAGGKGINVSIFLGRLGVENIAMGFVAGHTGRAIKRAVREEGVTTNFSWVDGETRTNVAILRKGKEDQPIEVNESGPSIPKKSQRQFIDQYKLMLKRASYVVISGSIPPNVPAEIYARLVKMAQEMQVKTFVNTGPPQLEQVAQEGPYLIKPDIRETATVFGDELTSRSSILKVGRKMLDFGSKYVLISHEITGDILISDEGCWDFEAVREKLDVKNQVGAGDALIGGIVYKMQNGKSPVEAVKYGMGAAIASVETYDKMCRDSSLITAEMDKLNVNKLEDAV